MARLSARLGYHVDETSQSYTQTGRAPIIRLLLRRREGKRNIHTECCSFTQPAAFPYRQHILTDNNLRSVSLTPPLFFQPRLDDDGVHRNGGCAAGCLSQTWVGESEMEKEEASWPSRNTPHPKCALRYGSNGFYPRLRTYLTGAEVNSGSEVTYQHTFMMAYITALAF